ncbi:MAG: DUF6265 family protein [Polyangiales bacterium]
MRVALVILVVLACLGCAASPRGAVNAAPPRVSFAWLRGTWCGPIHGGVFCETWRDDGDALAGDGALRVEGQTRFSERLRIEARPDGVFYVATPEGEGTTAFRLAHGADGEARFENPAHDFPTRIRYRREGADGLVAEVENDARRSTFRLRRQGAP